MPKGLKTTTITESPRPRKKSDAEAVADPTLDSLQLLLREAGRYPLLRPSEEIELPSASRRATSTPRTG
jgi:RNA polymerase primary sigma factor